MMGIGITQVLLMAAPGYWLLTRLSHTEYEAARQAGYHLFFKSIVYGIFLLVPGLILITFPLFFVRDFQISAFIAEIFIISGVFGFILADLIPRIWGQLPRSKERRWVHIKKAAKDRGNLLEILLEDAKTDGELVELSLKNGKVYVGFVVESGIASKEQNTDISLIPAWSGYREKDTRKLLIAYDYSAVVMPLQDRRHKEMTEGKTAQHEHGESWGEDFRVVIPMEQIEIARAVPKDQAINYEFTPDSQSVTTEGAWLAASPGMRAVKKSVDVE